MIWIQKILKIVNFENPDFQTFPLSTKMKILKFENLGLSVSQEFLKFRKFEKIENWKCRFSDFPNFCNFSFKQNIEKIEGLKILGFW